MSQKAPRQFFKPLAAGAPEPLLDDLHLQPAAEPAPVPEAQHLPRPRPLAEARAPHPDSVDRLPHPLPVLPVRRLAFVEPHFPLPRPARPPPRPPWPPGVGPVFVFGLVW